jgi:hypothetical protein
MPVFSFVTASDVFKQCAPCSDRNRVWWMRKEVAEETRNKHYDAQKKLLKDRGDEVTPFIVRAISDAVGILTTGTCPDQHVTLARTSDSVRYGNNVQQSIIGGYTPLYGLFTLSPSTPKGEIIGVVPGLPCDSSPGIDA